MYAVAPELSKVNTVFQKGNDRAKPYKPGDQNSDKIKLQNILLRFHNTMIPVDVD